MKLPLTPDPLDAEQLAFKVLLWYGKMKQPTTGQILEALNLKAQEYCVTNRTVIEHAKAIILERTPGRIR